MNLITVSLLVLISITGIVLLTSKLRLNAFISLFLVSVFLAVTAIPGGDIVNIMKEGFGTTMASIGLLIILGAIIAIILDKTGGALSIANFILSKTGEKNAAVALGITGFISGMPIFCDSGFIILSGLARSISAKTRISMSFIATVLACSLYAVHCLIPPHPGALAASGILNVPVGYLILLGITFALPGVIAAYFWTKRLTMNKDYVSAAEPVSKDHERTVQLPSAFHSFLPIAVPLVLITVNSIVTILWSDSSNNIVRILAFAGQPIMALSIGVALSLSLIKTKGIKTLNAIFESAIEKAGPILIVTAAGGMFGNVIKETGIGVEAGKILSKTGFGLAIPFLIACLMKTAQGSSTVAMITAASFVAPMMQLLGLESDWGRLFTMLAMGSGSMMISHANDSYFWVVTRFSDIQADETLRVFSTATAIMGITIFFVVWLVSLFVI